MRPRKRTQNQWESSVRAWWEEGEEGKENAEDSSIQNRGRACLFILTSKTSRWCYSPAYLISDLFLV